MSPTTRLKTYRLFGAAPYIASGPPEGSIPSSAWDYAARRVSAAEDAGLPAT